MKNKIKKIVVMFLCIMMFSNLFITNYTFAQTNRDDIIRNAVLTNKNYLRYDSIISTCNKNGLTDVSKNEIDNAIHYVADNNGKVRISDQSFLMTMSMLDNRYNEMLWPGTHNSFTNDADGDPNYVSIKDANNLSKNIVEAGNIASTENHAISIKEQLNRGIRCIDIDLGPKQTVDGLLGGAVNGLLKEISGAIVDSAKYVGDKIAGWFTGHDSHPSKPKFDINSVKGSLKEDFNYVYSYHRIAFMGTTKVSTIIDSIKDFLNENPNDVVTLNISDIYQAFEYIKLDKNNSNAYKLFNLFMKKLDEAGLLRQTANYFGDGHNVTNSTYHEYLLMAGESLHGNSMDEWPLLSDMILNNKRLVIITPTMFRDRNDSKAYKNMEVISFNDPKPGEDKPYRVSPENLNLNIDNIKNYPSRLTKVHAFCDQNKPAGDINAGFQNNNGRRVYDLVNTINNKLKENNVKRVLNFYWVDYFLGDKYKGGVRDIDIVDGANRINFEQQGYNWNDIITIDKKLYWDYFDMGTNRTINDYIESATTDIDGHNGYEFIDKNVWTGTESQNVKNKSIVVKLNKEAMINKLYVNYFAYEDEVPIEILLKTGGTSYNVGIKSIKQDRLHDWYSYNLDSYYKADEIKIIFRTDKSIHIKEVALGGTDCNNSYLSKTLLPEDDTFVKWASKSKYNYHKDNYNINNLEVYDGAEDKAAFLKFDMKDFKSLTRKVKKAYLSFKVADINKKVTLKLCEDRDATNWKDTELTGNIAKNFDKHVCTKSMNIQSDGYVKFDVTDQINDYINGSDKDKKMTYRIYTTTNEWFVVKSSETDTPPRLEIYYEEVDRTLVKPSADAYVKRGKYGGKNYNNSRIEISYDSRHDHRRYGLMRFSLDGITDVKKATLRIYTDNKQSDDAPINLMNINKDWNESSVTWDNIRAYFDNKIRASFTVTNDKWYEIDVTSWIKELIKNNKDFNFGLVIPSGNKDNVEFGSRESDRVPVLIIDN